MYAGELSKKYSNVKLEANDEGSGDEQVYTTNEGPVLIATSGKDVFVSESFDLTTARKLELLMLGAQKSSGMQEAASLKPLQMPGLTSGLVRFMGGCGVMKAALLH